MPLNKASLAKLKGVHPDLVRVVMHVAETSPMEFIITCGLRTIEEQRVLLAKGASKTLKSRHLTGHAVDVAMMIDGKVRWDWPLYDKFSKSFKASAKACGVPIEWGGDWTKFRDGPHYQLPWISYPIKKGV